MNDKAKDIISGTVTVETEPQIVTEEVTFSVNDVFDSFDELS